MEVFKQVKINIPLLDIVKQTRRMTRATTLTTLFSPLNGRLAPQHGEDEATIGEDFNEVVASDESTATSPNMEGALPAGSAEGRNPMDTGIPREAEESNPAGSEVVAKPVMLEALDPQSFQEGRMLGWLEGEIAHMRRDGLLAEV